MIKVITVCGNGIGSSLLLKLKIEELAREEGIEVDAESIDSGNAAGKSADLFVTVKELASIFPKEQRVAVITSYTNKKKIRNEVLPVLQELSNNK
ncbi:PTS system IIB component, L-Asc family [Amphibacillus marinus]|uniref:PTS system IIB component, L-Asc family n=1 Tax=Amphibacillus marinus TaxID=872970 RepID=A0A1H8MW83_9BACI|nr:PTS sugar transporter subunit IIB [Amphibacillus marinus]SEO21655.1 PTS system IIB component, L-Asc family [Amphibacillus marinus]